MDPKKLSTILLVVGSIGMVALAIEWLRMRLNGWLALIVVSLILLIMALLIHPGRAHEHSRPDLDGWFSSLVSAKGPCCGGPKIDATVIEDPDWESKAGRYRVRIEGEWYDVPDDAVLKQPNLFRKTLVWPIKGWGGLTIRCFMPGPMT